MRGIRNAEVKFDFTRTIRFDLLGFSDFLASWLPTSFVPQARKTRRSGLPAPFTANSGRDAAELTKYQTTTKIQPQCSGINVKIRVGCSSTVRLWHVNAIPHIYRSGNVLHHWFMNGSVVGAITDVNASPVLTSHEQSAFCLRGS